GEQDVRPQVSPVRDRRFEQALEYRIGRREEAAEQEEERQAECDATPDRGGPTASHPGTEAFPGNVAFHQLERPGERRGARAGGAEQEGGDREAESGHLPPRHRSRSSHGLVSNLLAARRLLRPTRRRAG